MDKENFNRSVSGNENGVIYKAAHLSTHEVTEDDMKAINKFTLSPLTADEVFTFKAVLCDNELDRDYERFTLKTLKDLEKLYVGKTVIKDHLPSADNQVARVYSTELKQTEKLTKSGEFYTQLIANCYMVKTAGNADLIAEIKGGIKKEGSVGCSISSAVCSICGTDNAKTYCRHYKGREYEKDSGKTICTYTLDGAKDAYEFSLVAVPAQRNAGVSKSYGETTVFEEADKEEEARQKAQEAFEAEKEKTEIRLRLSQIQNSIIESEE